LVRACFATTIGPKSATNVAKISLWEKILGAEEVRREAEGLFAFSDQKPETTSLTRINRAYGLKTVVVKPHQKQYKSISILEEKVFLNIFF
jgi:hypothetical protein